MNYGESKYAAIALNIFYKGFRSVMSEPRNQLEYSSMYDNM